MLSVRGFLLVMLKSAFVVSFLSVPRPVVAFAGLKNWSRKALYTKIDLCTQACYSQIIPGLYLSNAQAAGDRDVLSRLNITHVLTVAEHRLPKSTFKDTNIKTLYIWAADLPHTNLLPYFPMANKFIDKGLRNGNVIVHCHIGVSRSATVVIAYLMAKFKMSFEEAYAFVKEKRQTINPNDGFVRQLQEFHRLNYQVSGCLYLSNAVAAGDRAILKRLGITHVLTVEAKRLPSSTFLDTDIKYLFIQADDSADTQLLPYFPLANSFIKEGLENGKVIVHCRFGISRSATIVIAYIMQRYRLTYEEGFAYVRQRRRFINPNPGFVEQLKEYQRYNYFVSGVQRLGAYMKVNSGENKYKMVSIAAVIIGILIPVLLLLG